MDEVKPQGVRSGSRRARLAARVATLLFVVALAAPHRERWRHPSLFADDVVRVGDLRHNALSELLFRPINEHVAPLTETLSWLCWRLADARLSAAPATFTTAALAALAVALAAIGWLLRRETGSDAAAFVAMATLGGSAVALETYWWYSAGTFTLALAFTLGSVALAGAAARSGRWWWGIASALASFAAPAWSGIGLLAGPAACLRWGLDGQDVSPWRRARALLPLVGTVGYLVLVRIAAPAVLQAPEERWRASPAVAVAAAADAFAGVLVPELVTGTALSPPPWLALGLASGFVGAVLAVARRHPQRGLLVAALLLVAGGYVLPYLARATPGDLDATRQIQRYHLFPMAGLIVVLATLAAPALRRLDRRPGAGAMLGVAVLLGLAVTQGGKREVFARFYRFPHQPAALRAFERVDAIAARSGLTTVQARAAIGPLRPNWMPLKEFDATMLIGPAAPAARFGDAEARAILLAALEPEEREALAEPVEATAARVPAAGFPTVVGVGRARPVPGLAVDPTGGAVAFLGPKYLEFDLAPAGDAPPKALGLPAGAPGAMELWWAGADGRWSPSRSVRWRAAGDAAGAAIPLDRLPLWQADRVRRVRVIVRHAGPTTLEPPRLLR
jgi:hypothetical protein